LLLIPLGLLAIRVARHALAIDQRILLPLILMFSIVGAFAVNNAVFDLWIVLILGLLGWIMEENGFPVAPMVLGMVLGKIVEESFTNSMIKADGNIIAFFDRPIAGGLAFVFFSIWLLPIVTRLVKRRNRSDFSAS
jgi:TctA family transporter